jgi:hypothetical protein
MQEEAAHLGDKLLFQLLQDLLTLLLQLQQHATPLGECRGQEHALTLSSLHAAAPSATANCSWSNQHSTSAEL